jgi:flavodoxin
MERKILIAYFSRPGENYAGGSMVQLKTGNTAEAAQKLAALTNGELFEIRRVTPYAAGYRACVDESVRELKENARPDLAKSLADIDRYDTVILAYPCWCGTMPMPVWTFLEQYDFSGKTILPLCTHEGSGMGKSEADIRKLCPGAVLKKGLAVVGSKVGGCDGVLAGWLKTELD